MRHEGALDGGKQAKWDGRERARTATPGTGWALQHVPEAQGEGASEPADWPPGLRHLRGSRSHARRAVCGLWRAQAPAGPQPLLRVLQARVALGAPEGRARAAGSPHSPAQAGCV